MRKLMKNISKVNKEFYEKFYSQVLNPLYLYEIYYRVALVKKLIKEYSGLKNKRVLDVGFGSGEMLAVFDESCEVCGVEISECSKQLFLRKGKKFRKIKIIIQDLNLNPKLNFNKGFFDIIILSHILEHIIDYKKIIKEIYRIVKTDGTIFIALPLIHNCDIKLHSVEVSIKKIIKEVRRAGFHTIYSEKNLYTPQLPLVYIEDKSPIRLIVSNFSFLLNFLLSISGYNSLKFLDMVFAKLKLKPRQQIIVVKK
jgi:ubiquinone/menaquinone biosynthesis C-methylase UbiE